MLRDARRIEEYHPGLSPYSAESMDKLGVSLAHCESKCNNFYDAAERWSIEVRCVVLYD